MGRSQAYVAPAPSEKTWDDFVKCEIENNDKHRVEPESWPPKRLGNIAGEPSMSLRCVRCGTNCIVYGAHATGELGGIEVVLPKERKK